MIGKVFWVGRRSPRWAAATAGEVELALHELARKELVRPSRRRSMEGESEYGFWHVLVRDVAYGQIPRAERARRTARPPPGSSARPASGSRTWPRCSPTTTCEALELAEAAGDAEQAEELALPARRFLALAGERALGLDTAQARSAARPRARAHPGRRSRAARAARSLGRGCLSGRPAARGRGRARGGAHRLPRPRTSRRPPPGR